MKMRGVSNLKHTIKAKSKAFCKHSTLHGVYYFYSSTVWWVHATWALVIAASIGLCCFLSHMIWQKYAVDPTLTVVETTRYSITNIPYPAVTVCDTEMVYGPKTMEISEVLRLRGYNKSQLDDFFTSFTSVKHKDYSPSQHVKKMHSLLEDLEFTYKILLDMFKKPCDKLLLECKWRSKTFNCSTMFREVYTFAGYCCQFDIPYFRETINEDVSFVSGNQAVEALQVAVNSEKTHFDGITTNGFIRLYVFDPKDTVTPMDSFITLTPGGFFDVNVLVWTIDSSSNVKELSVQSRKCTLDSDPDIGAKFYQACMTRLLLHKAVGHCRCLPFEYTLHAPLHNGSGITDPHAVFWRYQYFVLTDIELGVNEYPSCNWEKLLCIHQMIEEVQSDIRHIVSTSQCYQKCDYVEYGTEVEYIQLQRNLGEGIGNQSQVSVHFNDNTCFKYRREILYTWDQMLANLGGIFGLCLGGSIISVIELVWYFIDIIISIFQFPTKGKIASSKVLKTAWSKQNEKENVFSLTQYNDFSRKKSVRKSTKTKPYKYVN